MLHKKCCKNKKNKKSQNYEIIPDYSNKSSKVSSFTSFFQNHIKNIDSGKNSKRSLHALLSSGLHARRRSFLLLLEIPRRSLWSLAEWRGAPRGKKRWAAAPRTDFTLLPSAAASLPKRRPSSFTSS